VALKFLTNAQQRLKENGIQNAVLVLMVILQEFFDGNLKLKPHGEWTLFLSTDITMERLP
jgi:hypothetical protein